MRAEKSRYFVRNIEEDIMYKILKAEKLNEIVYLMVVEAPMVAKHCQPCLLYTSSLPFGCRDIEESQPCTVCQSGTSYIVFCGNLDERYGKWYFIHDVFFHIENIRRRKEIK